jgi:hypothetical protein
MEVIRSSERSVDIRTIERYIEGDGKIKPFTCMGQYCPPTKVKADTTKEIIYINVEHVFNIE